MRCTISLLAALLFFGLPTAPASAQITDLGYTVNGLEIPIVHGDEVRYYGKGTVQYPWMISSWSMRWRWVCPNHPTDFSRTSIGYGWPSFTIFHGIPGQWEIELAVIYTNFMTFEHVSNQFVKGFWAAPPDKAVIVIGLDTPQRLDMPIGVTFAVYAGDRLIGVNAVGMAQETWSQIWKKVPPLTPPEYDSWNGVWKPDLGETSTTFYRFTHSIFDVHGHGPEFPWSELPLGIYHQGTQHLRLILETPCRAEWFYYPLGKVYLERVKVDDSHWMLRKQSLPQEP